MADQSKEERAYIPTEAEVAEAKRVGNKKVLMQADLAILSHKTLVQVVLEWHDSFYKEENRANSEKIKREAADVMHREVLQVVESLMGATSENDTRVLSLLAAAVEKYEKVRYPLLSDAKEKETNVEEKGKIKAFRATSSHSIVTVTFDDLVQYGRDAVQCKPEEMPWSFNYMGYPVSHENNDLYLITTLKETLRLARGSSVSFPVPTIKEWLENGQRLIFVRGKADSSFVDISRKDLEDVIGAYTSHLREEVAKLMQQSQVLVVANTRHFNTAMANHEEATRLKAELEASEACEKSALSERNEARAVKDMYKERYIQELERNETLKVRYDIKE